MAQQQINNGESAALVRQKLNDNFLLSLME